MYIHVENAPGKSVITSVSSTIYCPAGYQIEVLRTPVRRMLSYLVPIHCIVFELHKLCIILYINFVWNIFNEAECNLPLSSWTSWEGMLSLLPTPKGTCQLISFSCTHDIASLKPQAHRRIVVPSSSLSTSVCILNENVLYSSVCELY